MTRRCAECGTQFDELINDKEKGIMIVDKIPECWKGDKMSGRCIKCCDCHKSETWS